jgi:ketosteroid isomerase-like protein
MKKLFMILPLVFLLCITSSCQKAEEVAEEPSVDVEAEKAALAESLQNLLDAAVKGDAEKVKSFWHPQISWWYYTQEQPHGIDVWLKGFEELHSSDVKWASCDAKPLEIHVVGNVAILYIVNKNTMIDAEGNETTTFGPWTSVWIKKDAKWMMLSNSWTDIE